MKIENLATIITITAAVCSFLLFLYKIYKTVNAELWSEGCPTQTRKFIRPQYVIENFDSKDKRIDKLLVKILLKRRGPRAIVIFGEAGIGKSFLLQKVYYSLMYKTMLRGIQIKHVSAANLKSFEEAACNTESKKTILFLDGLDEYSKFSKINTAHENKEAFYQLFRHIEQYGRVVITVRSAFYVENKENFEWLGHNISMYNRTIKIELKEPADKQIQSYLKHNLNLNAAQIRKCMHLIHTTEGALGKPLFLDFLSFLPECINAANRYTIYEEIVKNWLAHERSKCAVFVNGKYQDDIENVFNIFTNLYFLRLSEGNNDIYFQLDDLLKYKYRTDDIPYGACSLFQYNVKHGYYCIHRSFLEFNYVRLHYHDIYMTGLKNKKYHFKNMLSFYEECHYNRKFTKSFPNAEVVLLDRSKKQISELLPEDIGRIISINVLSSKDLLREDFQFFLFGLLTPLFTLGKFTVNNIQLREVIKNRKLKLCDIKVKSTEDFAWFQFFPIRSLNVSHTGIESLGFLKFFPELKKLISVGNLLSGLDGLESCPDLEYLNASNCRLESDMLINRLPDSLRFLIISNNEISDLDFVSLTNLHYLDISDNPLNDNVGKEMRIPDKVRDQYHFESAKIKSIILGNTLLDNSVIRYEDIREFVHGFAYGQIPDRGVTSLFGLENIRFESIAIPINSVMHLSILSRPLHTNRVFILAKYEYKVGYRLNRIFNKLNCLRPYELDVRNIYQLYYECDGLLNHFSFWRKGKEESILEPCAEIIRIMEKQQSVACIDEIIRLAAICLMNIPQKELRDNVDMQQKEIFDFSMEYMKKNTIFNTFTPKQFKNLYEQYTAFQEYGNVFEKAIEIISSHTKGLVDIGWASTRTGS